MNKHAAIYVNATTNDSWKNTAIKSEIARLTEYAESKGYLISRVYLENGYDGHGILSPCHAVMYRDYLSGMFGAVIIASPVSFGIQEQDHSLLCMETDEIQKASARLFLADMDMEAMEYIKRNRERWVTQDLDRDAKDSANGSPLQKTLDHIEAEMKKQDRLIEEDLAGAVEPTKVSDFGDNVIEAAHALWLLKNGYKEDVVKAWNENQSW